MLIQCTQTLLDKFKFTPDLSEPKGHLNDFYAWHAHWISVERRKIILLINNLTRYPVIFYRPSENNMKHASKMFQEGIRRAWQEEGIDQHLIDRYFLLAGKLTYAKSGSMKHVSRLNALCQDMKYYYKYMTDTRIVYQPMLSPLLSHLPQQFNRLELPIKKTMEQLKRNSGYGTERPSIETLTYRLYVRIDLKHTEVSCRFSIPAHHTFYQLHESIRKIFDWSPSLPHEFIVGDTRIVDGSKEENKDGMKDTLTRLNEWLDIAKRFVYQGAWKHLILVEDVYMGHHASPILLEKNGIRPPSSMRSERQYQNFIKIMQNPESKRYRQVKAWSREKERCDRQYSVAQINWLLKQWPQSCRYNSIHVSQPEPMKKRGVKRKPKRQKVKSKSNS